MPTDQVHLWLLILVLGKSTEIDQYPHVISKSEMVLKLQWSKSKYTLTNESIISHVSFMGANMH